MSNKRTKQQKFLDEWMETMVEFTDDAVDMMAQLNLSPRDAFYSIIYQAKMTNRIDDLVNFIKYARETRQTIYVDDYYSDFALTVGDLMLAF